MKYTIGMLELNPFEVLGEPLFSQRYCSQVIIPLLGMLEAEKRLRMTLTATGSVVEYLAEHFPVVLNKCRALIENGQIELLCSMYTNADWQIFPSADLRRSHRMTDHILRTNGLPLARKMVAQDNTYWPAMASFQDEFDVYLVRDKFLKGRGATRRFPQMARVGKSLLLVASNNLLHDMAARFVAQKTTNAIGLFTEARLETAVETWGQSDPRFVDIAIGEDNWHWFHSAGAHHFTTGAALRNWDAFFCDPDWMRTVQDHLEAKLNEESTFRLVSEFSDAAGTLLDTLPDLGDASWGFNAGSDHAYWLAAPERRVRAVLSWTSLSWRSRAALRKAEALVEKARGHQPSEVLDGQIEALWRRQLWTEVSPVASRAVSSYEVDFVRDHAERVLSLATELCLQLGPSDLLHNAAVPWGDGMGSLEPSAAVVETQLVNGEGSVKWFSNRNGVYRCEARFTAEETTCGIGFKLSSNGIGFSGCGHEGEIASVALSSFDDGEGVLLSTTGLYSLGADLFLIRHNCVLSVGAQVEIGGLYLRFVVDFAPEGRNFEWPFTIVQGSSSTAIAVANQINAI